jgi:hypothetical protein
MKPEMEHKYHTESMESSTLVTKTMPASSSVCTKVKTASAPPPVYTASKPASSVCPKAEIKTVEKPYTKVETKTVEKPYTKVEVKTVEKPYTKVEVKTVEKPYTKVEVKTVEKPYTKTVEKPYIKIETKTIEKPASCKSQPMSVSTTTVGTTLTKTFAVNTCSQAGPTDKPCSCKHNNEGDKHECSCKKTEKHAEEEHGEEEYEEEMHEEEMYAEEETEHKCPGYLSKGFEVCLHLPSPSHLHPHTKPWHVR